MNCFICGGNMTAYMKKTYPYKDLIEEAVFKKCENCGLVVNETMYELPADKWKRINEEIHASFQGTDCSGNDPKWVTRISKQAKTFFELFNLGVFNKNMNCIDYGCGDGKLSDYFDELSKGREFYGALKKYDKFMSKVHGGEARGYLKDEEIIEGKFDVVITCSVFEHLVGFQDIDRIIKLTKTDTGVLCTHTLVCENVPQDSEWFYIARPTHCTMWTNKAMTILFKRYGFKGCAYNLESQMWFFFYDANVLEKLKNIENDAEGKWFFSDDFIDYWKEPPYRK